MALHGAGKPAAMTARRTAAARHGSRPPSGPRRGKTNFFERRVGEYQRAGVMQSVNKQGGRKYEHVFSLTEDF